MKDAIILGTRPEIIKCAPLIKLYEEKNTELVLIHTNQHYSFEMDEIFFNELQLRKPDYNLNVGSGSHAEQTGKIMLGVEKLLQSEIIGCILVQGDTNTVMGSALAAAKIQVKIGHIEAGLRSNDRTMPEEINRVITDHISDYLFCPTELSRQNLLKEGIAEEKIHVVGNTVVDATFQNYEIAKDITSSVLESLNIGNNSYSLLTAHRPANVDDPERLKELIDIMKVIIEDTGNPIVFPVHMRTKAKLEEFDLMSRIPDEVRVVKPFGVLEFLVLEKNARYIFTDSGGVQEEACILRRPCITLRENTERPETVDVGGNIITGYDIKKIKDAMTELASRSFDYDIPFGDGTASQKIFSILHES
ncbi:MAG TPA: UDP-N-acetylglucosamine 2-epimerase (non-hydrolyzing) [Candidatus Lokiarchaeia archaeon]|nr:UDP-N-acetylglucosamine 2-epimerase (non-hydrolyzing) [Candidatus Lokiarchaeia archaeon]